MKLVLLSVGRDRNDPLDKLVKTYVERVQRTVAMEVVELKEEPLRKGISAAVAMRREAERIEERAEGCTIALDRDGWAGSSRAWAEQVGRLREASRSVTWIVGGPFGLDPEFLARVERRWSLGPLTLPHKIARLVVAEQIYRAISILRDEPYHK